MNDERLQGLYRAGLVGRERPTDEPVSLEELQALASGMVPEERRAPLLDRVMSDPDLVREFELLRAVHRAGLENGSQGGVGTALGGAPAGSSRTGAGTSWSRPRALVALATAAVVVLVLGTSLLFRASGGPDQPRMRGGEGGEVLSARGPAHGATVAEPVTLVWTTVPDAVGYRIEVLDREGALALRETTADTTLTIAPGVLLRGSEYRWWVEAVQPAGVDQSEVRSFVLAP